MRRYLFSLFFVVLMPSSVAVAAEPVTGQDQTLAETGWQWMLTDTDTLRVQMSNALRDNATYDISECMFCSGEEDNCQEDGVFPVNLPENEPAIAVVCHTGAHSQRVQVLAPMRDRKQPVFTATGTYWVDYQPLDRGFNVTFDKRGSDGTPSINTVTWPE